MKKSLVKEQTVGTGIRLHDLKEDDTGKKIIEQCDRMKEAVTAAMNGDTTAYPQSVYDFIVKEQQKLTLAANTICTLVL